MENQRKIGPPGFHHPATAPWDMVDKTNFRFVLPGHIHTFDWFADGVGDEMYHSEYQSDTASFFDGSMVSELDRNHITIDFNLYTFPEYEIDDNVIVISSCFIHLRVSVIDEAGVEVSVLSDPKLFDPREIPSGIFGVLGNTEPVIQYLNLSDSRLYRISRFPNNPEVWSIRFRASVWLYEPWDIMAIPPRAPRWNRRYDNDGHEITE